MFDGSIRILLITLSYVLQTCRAASPQVVLEKEKLLRESNETSVKWGSQHDTMITMCF